MLRSMAFLGDALAHAILPGVAIASWWENGCLRRGLHGLPASWWRWASDVSRAAGGMRRAPAIGIYFAGRWLLGVVLVERREQLRSPTLTHVLFGNVLGVTATDLCR